MKETSGKWQAARAIKARVAEWQEYKWMQATEHVYMLVVVRSVEVNINSNSMTDSH